MDNEQQMIAEAAIDTIEDAISDEEVEAFIALVEERLIEKLIRAIENATEPQGAALPSRTRG